MPALRRARAAILFQHGLLLFEGEGRFFAGVETDRNNVELFPGIEADHTEAADHSVEDLGTEHGTGIVHERKNNGALPEVVSEFDVTARIVAERQIKRNLSVKLLIDADILQR